MTIQQTPQGQMNMSQAQSNQMQMLIQGTQPVDNSQSVAQQNFQQMNQTQNENDFRSQQEAIEANNLGFSSISVVNGQPEQPQNQLQQQQLLGFQNQQQLQAQAQDHNQAI
jgi:hypothetical protein